MKGDARLCLYNDKRGSSSTRRFKFGYGSLVAYTEDIRGKSERTKTGADETSLQLPSRLKGLRCESAPMLIKKGSRSANAAMYDIMCYIGSISNRLCIVLYKCDGYHLPESKCT